MSRADGTGAADGGSGTDRQGGPGAPCPHHHPGAEQDGHHDHHCGPHDHCGPGDHCGHGDHGGQGGLHEHGEHPDSDAAKVAVHLGLGSGLSIEAEMHTAGSSGPLLPAAFAILIVSLAHLCLAVGMAAAAVWAGAPDYLCVVAGAAGLGVAWLLTRDTLQAAGTVPLPPEPRPDPEPGQAEASVLPAPRTAAQAAAQDAAPDPGTGLASGPGPDPGSAELP
ncbi:hypothetical protein AB0D08_13115 [Kitasatospora sp. NPDC048540]|uniref:hypothetical protein n=1 Tax=unclassified Kitasatospora TaxID=2633591 RepID=UPI000539FC62|nr:hypothetical protein [Kitasatospora sp. MBT63]